MRRLTLLVSTAAAGLVAAVALTSPVHGDVLPTLPVTVTVPTLPVPPAPPPPALPPPPPVAPLPPPPPLAPVVPAPPAPVAPRPPALALPRLPGARSGEQAPSPSPRAGDSSSPAVAARSRRVSATRTHFSLSGTPGQRGTVISFRLRRRGRVELVVHEGCVVVGRKRVRGHAGLNQVPFDGRVQGKALELGRYTIAVVVTRGRARKMVGNVAIEVVRPGHSVTKAQRRAPVAAAGCLQRSASGETLLGALSAIFAPRVRGADERDPATPPRSAGAFVPPSATPTASFKPPTLPPSLGDVRGGGGGRPFVALWLLLGLLVVGLLVYGAVALDGALNRRSRVRG